MSGGPSRVVVITDDAQGSGGASAIAVANVRGLLDRRIPVTLMSGHSKVSPDLQESEYLRVLALGGRTLLEQPRSVAFARGLYDHRMARALAEWIRANDTPSTVYHLHNWHKVLSPSIFFALRSVSERLVLSAHDFFLFCPNGSFFLFPESKLCPETPMSVGCLRRACDKRAMSHKVWRVARHMVRQLALNLDERSHIVVPHEGMLPYLERAGGKRRRVNVVRNPVAPWAEERIEAEENSEILFVGRLESDKGPDLLAEAAAAAGVKVTFIGDGPLQQDLKERHPNHEYGGWMAREQIVERVRRARLLVVPSRVPETFGLVVFEALTSGIPVILSRHSVATEELQAQGLVWAIDPFDTKGLGALLAELSQDDDAIGRASELAFSSSRSLVPTEPEWVDQLVGLYRNVVS